MAILWDRNFNEMGEMLPRQLYVFEFAVDQVY